MAKRSSRVTHGPRAPIKAVAGGGPKVTVLANGKVQIPADEFQAVFSKLIAGHSVEVTHADPSTFKTNPVVPGVGPAVIDAATWTKRWKSHSDNAATDWEERALTPSGDPIANAIAADAKRKDRLAEAERQEKWLKTMKKRTAADVFEGIQAVGTAGYTGGIKKSEKKAGRRFTELQPLVETLKKTLGAMDESTKQARGLKMLGARDGMLAIGEKLRA